MTEVNEILDKFDAFKSKLIRDLHFLDDSFNDRQATMHQSVYLAGIARRKLSETISEIDTILSDLYQLGQKLDSNKP